MQNETSLPVFVFPTQLSFYVKDTTSHRHLITIYNPYDFVVSYQVLCTSPASYTVIEPEGVLKPRCCIDIENFKCATKYVAWKRKIWKQLHLILRDGFSAKFYFKSFRTIRRLNLQQLTPVQQLRVDKFRIYVRRRDKPELSGFRDVLAEVLLEKKQRDVDTDSTTSDFRGWPRREFSQASIVQYPLPTTKSGRPGWLLMIVAGICIACLSAHTQGETSASIPFLPEWFSLSISQKLVAAYVLGLVTAAFLQS